MGEARPIRTILVVDDDATIVGSWRRSAGSERTVHAAHDHNGVQRLLAQHSFDPNVGAKLWGAALVLLGLVFSLSLAALPARLRAHEEANV